MSRTIKFTKAGGPEVLEFIETKVKAPAPRPNRNTSDKNRRTNMRAMRAETIQWL